MKKDKERLKELDATVAWLMEEYTHAVQEALDYDPETCEPMPEELDKKCRALIKKEMSRQRRVQIAKKIGRITCAVALTIVMLFGVVGILFTTVEAVRAPIIRFFIAQKEGHLEITDSGEESDMRTLTNAVDFDEMNARLAALLPEGYTQMVKSVSDAECIVTYTNQEGGRLVFSVSLKQRTSHFDVEESASTERTKVGTYDAILVEKNGYRLTWFDSENNVLYKISSNVLDRNEIIHIANNLS